MVGKGGGERKKGKGFGGRGGNIEEGTMQGGEKEPSAEFTIDIVFESAGEP